MCYNNNQSDSLRLHCTINANMSVYMLEMKNMTNSVPFCIKDALKGQLSAIALEFATV